MNLEPNIRASFSSSFTISYSLVSSSMPMQYIAYCSFPTFFSYKAYCDSVNSVKSFSSNSLPRSLMILNDCPRGPIKRLNIADAPHYPIILTLFNTHNKKASQARYSLTRFADSLLRGIQSCNCVTILNVSILPR